MAIEPSARLDRPSVPYGRRSAGTFPALAAFFVFRLDLRLIRNPPSTDLDVAGKPQKASPRHGPMPRIEIQKPPYAMTVICYQLIW
jgi:hypothetical protein